jgi:tetratricopeptide (TPR) repeat protein
MGEYDRSIEDLDQAIRLNPYFFPAYNNRGYAHDGNAEYEAAIADYSAAIRLKPDLAEGYNNRGWSESAEGQYDRAIGDFDQAIRLMPNYANAYNDRGDAFNAKGEYERAIQDYDRAIQLEPDWAPLLALSKGVALTNLSRFQDAIASFKTYVAARPKDAYGVLRLYIARRHAGVEADNALKTDIGSLNLKTWPAPIVRAYLGLGTADAAYDAAADSPGRTATIQNCEAAFYMGELDLISGRTDIAKTEFQRALDVCRENFNEIAGAKAELSQM